MGAALAGEQIAAIGRGQKILRAALDDPQAMIVQLQIGDDLRIEQAHGVGRDRIAKTGIKFLRHRGAADHLAALDDFYAQSGHRQIGRAGEAIVPRADDDNVGVCHADFISLFATNVAPTYQRVIAFDARHREERPLGRVSKDRPQAPGPSFETPRKRAAPQDEG